MLDGEASFDCALCMGSWHNKCCGDLQRWWADDGNCAHVLGEVGEPSDGDIGAIGKMIMEGVALCQLCSCIFTALVKGR